MPFQQLPTEVKQLIVDEAAKSDQAYQFLKKRKERQSRHPPPSGVPWRGGEPVGPLAFRQRGKTVSNLSQTSKELRELSVKYLFEVSSTFRFLRQD